MRTLWLPGALALAVVALAPARGEEASTHLGVAVDVPDGFEWKPDVKRGSTVIYMRAADGGERPAEIVVNHIEAAGVTLDALARDYVATIQAPDFEHERVELPSGPYFRYEFSFEDEGGRRRNRGFATVRDGHMWTFALGAEAAGFDRLREGFDAMVAGARFFAPRPAPVARRPEPSPEPSPPEPAPRETPEPAPERPPEASPPDPIPQPTPDRPPEPVAEPTPEPSPEPSPPEPVAEPAPEPSPEPSPPEPVAESTPEAAPPAPTPGRAPEPAPVVDLLEGADLVVFSSEYDPDIWAAAHLTDGSGERGWCSAPGSRFPHRFVFALAVPARPTRVVFDADCPEEEGFQGVAARGFRLEVSALGPERGFRRVTEGELVAGEADQAFPVEVDEAVRWVRLTLTSNHGHPTLTELMEVGLLAAGGAADPDAGGAGLRLDRLRVSKERNGSAAEAPFAAGEVVWINLKPRGMATSSEDEYWLEVDLVLEDDAGHVLLRRDKILDHVARLPAPPLSPFVAVNLELPEGFPGGTYVVRLVVRDGFGEGSAAGAVRFEVAD